MTTEEVQSFCAADTGKPPVYVFVDGSELVVRCISLGWCANYQISTDIPEFVTLDHRWLEAVVGTLRRSWFESYPMWGEPH